MVPDMISPHVFLHSGHFCACVLGGGRVCMLKHSLADTSSTLLARQNYSVVLNPRLCVVAAAFWQEDPTFSERK